MNRSVIHVINGELYSGAERVQDLLATQLPGFGYDVGFACLKLDKFAEKMQAKSARLHSLPMSSRFDLSAGFKLANIVRDFNYQIIHTHTPRAAMVGKIASALSRVPMVHHVHSPTARDTESGLRNKINAFVENASLVGVRRLIPVSSSLKTYLVESGYKQDRIQVVPNGVPTPGPMPERDAPTPEFVVGSVALFRPRKGVEILLKAVALLRSNGLPVRLRCVGPFETEAYEAEVKSLVRLLKIDDYVEWTGFTSNVGHELRNMDVFVLPSLFGEGMPMVILEAMANGVPVIASDVEGIPEILSGGAGVVVPPRSETSLAEALKNLLSDPRGWRSLRETAYQRQSERFSDRAMAHGVARIYDHFFEENPALI